MISMTQRKTAPRIAALASIAFASAVSFCLLGSCASAVERSDSLSDRARAKADGSYRGKATAEVPFGAIALLPRAEVEVSISGGKIASIRMLTPRAVAAKPEFAELAKRVVAAQSLDVDTVSGATYSSRAFLLAVSRALEPKGAPRAQRP